MATQAAMAKEARPAWRKKQRLGGPGGEVSAEALRRPDCTFQTSRDARENAAKNGRPGFATVQICKLTLQP
ncbi:MAG: hypothetical protein FJ096_01355 [Deltaproteobacteria bacterium]|nr:hypothetical protein [Deltaproteobacteria bacterium]